MQIAPTAAVGYIQAVRRFDASAQRVARAGSPTANVDLAAEAVEQSSATTAVRANLASLKAADDGLRQLLDIKV